MTRTHPHPAEQLRRRPVDSSAVNEIAWDTHRRLFVKFKDGRIYQYEGVPYQRAVAAARADSVGAYVARKIVPNYSSVRIV